MRFVCAVLAGLAVTASAHASTLSGFEGHWEGRAAVPGASITLVVDLAPDANGAWHGSATAPGFHVKGAPLTDIALRDEVLSFKIGGALGEPKLATHRTSSGRLEGSYELSGLTTDVAFVRTGAAQVELPRASSALNADVAGRWTALLELGAFKMNLALALTAQGTSPGKGEMTMLDSNYTVPLDLVTQDGAHLSFISGRTGMEFDGELKRGALSGTVLVAGREFAVVWKRE